VWKYSEIWKGNSYDFTNVKENGSEKPKLIDIEYIKIIEIYHF